MPAATMTRIGHISERTILDNPQDFPMLGLAEAGIAEYLESELVMVDDLLVPRGLTDVQRATLETTDAGAFNALFTAVATMQLAQQKNFLGFVPKRGYEQRGHRVRSTRAISSGAGQAESASLPAAIETTYVEVPVGLKEALADVEMSIRMDIESLKNDAIRFETFVQNVYDDFLVACNADLLADGDTLAGNNFESVDRLTGATALVTAGIWDAGDEDPWAGAIDRSGASWADALALHNSGATRTLSRSLINALYAGLRRFWGTESADAGYYLTNTDTYTRWGELEGAAWRTSEVAILNRLEGAEPVAGAAGGYKTNLYEGRPILLDDAVFASTLGNVYLLNRDKLWLAMGRPIQVIQGDNIVYLGKTVKKSAFYGVMELTSDHLRGLGSLRDLA